MFDVQYSNYVCDVRCFWKESGPFCGPLPGLPEPFILISRLQCLSWVSLTETGPCLWCSLQGVRKDHPRLIVLLASSWLRLTSFKKTLHWSLIHQIPIHQIPFSSSLPSRTHQPPPNGDRPGPGDHGGTSHVARCREVLNKGDRSKARSLPEIVPGRCEYNPLDGTRESWCVPLVCWFCFVMTVCVTVNIDGGGTSSHSSTDTESRRRCLHRPEGSSWYLGKEEALLILVCIGWWGQEGISNRSNKI